MVGDLEERKQSYLKTLPSAVLFSQINPNPVHKSGAQRLCTAEHDILQTGHKKHRQ